jgi:hypothetical protein
MSESARVKATCLKILAAVFGLAGIYYAFEAALVRSYGPGGLVKDGFERQLSETPLIIRFLLSEESRWAGWGWFAIDLVVGWVLFTLCYLLLKWSYRIEGKRGFTGLSRM